MQTMAYAYTSVAGVSVPDPSNNSGAFHRKVPANIKHFVNLAEVWIKKGTYFA